MPELLFWSSVFELSTLMYFIVTVSEYLEEDFVRVICGVIKQNQSEVGQIQISLFKLTAPFSQLHFAENPTEIGHLVPKK